MCVRECWWRLSSDPNAIGKTIRAQGVELTVIGVLPPDFGGLQVDSAERRELLNVRPVVQRMGHGPSGYRDRFARPLTLILALTGLLLVLACINLGGLLLARLSARSSELFFETLGVPLLRGRLTSWLAGGIGLLAVLLALIGVHGTLAYSVSRRTREIGVRVAIGAAPHAAATTVLCEALVVTMTGVAIGLPMAYAGARTLKTLMFGITECDPPDLRGRRLVLSGAGRGCGNRPGATRGARGSNDRAEGRLNAAVENQVPCVLRVLCG